MSQMFDPFGREHMFEKFVRDLDGRVRELERSKMSGYPEDILACLSRNLRHVDTDMVRSAQTLIEAELARRVTERLTSVNTASVAKLNPAKL